MLDVAKRYSVGVLACAVAYFVSTSLAPGAFAQVAAIVMSDAKEPVPERSKSGQMYKSWSLFLVCNPSWVLPQNERPLQALFNNFQAFGWAIGPAHVAVWFRVSAANDKQAQVDVLRSAAFCESLKLAPSESPYIVITTEYPGAGRLDQYPASFPTKLSAFAVIGMAGKDVDEISRLMTSLADQLVLNKLSDLDAQQEEWWRGLDRAYEGVRALMVGASKGMTFRLKTPFFEVEKKS